MVMNTVNIKKINESATIPTQGTKYSAGYDLYADIPEGTRTVSPGQNSLIGTGIAVEIPEGYFGGVFARSGLAFKKHARPSNCVGVIDADYRGEIKVAIHNDSLDQDLIVTNGERIAQLVIIPFLSVDWNVVSELNETVRGEGGFGSTGKD